MSADAERLPPPRRVPKVVIELAIETAPRVRSDAATEEDFSRLADWINSNDALRKLIDDAKAIHHQHRGVT